MFHRSGRLAVKAAAGALSLVGAAGCSQALHATNNGQEPPAGHDFQWRDLALFHRIPPDVNFDRYSNKVMYASLHEGWSSCMVGELFGSGFCACVPLLRARTGVPIMLANVHFWKDNLESTKKAAREGRKIAIGGYSAGCAEAMAETKQLCSDMPDIVIDLVFLADPVFTCKVPLPIFTENPRLPFEFPPNVKEVFVVLSGGAWHDPLALGRGSEEVIREAAQNDPRIKVIRVLHEDTHFTLGKREVMVPLLEEAFSEVDPSLKALPPLEAKKAR